MAVACLSLALTLGFLFTRSSQVQFDSNGWFEDVDGQVRWRMMSDLTKRILPGKSLRDIEQLLGPSLTKGEMSFSNYSNVLDTINRFTGNGIKLSGDDHFFSEYQWDLLYSIKGERDSLVFPKIRELFLVIRLSNDGHFESWCVIPEASLWEVNPLRQTKVNYRLRR